LTYINTEHNSENEQEKVKKAEKTEKLKENDKVNFKKKESENWIEHTGSGDEDEYNAFTKAKEEFIKKQLVEQKEKEKEKGHESDTSSNEESSSVNELIGNKRQRHDTDDEDDDPSELKSEGKGENTDDELNELIPQDDEGDLILNENEKEDNKAGLMTLIEFKTKVK